MRQLHRIVFVLGVLALDSHLRADWPGFLGPGGNPVVVEGMPPSRFSGGDKPENVAWRTAIVGRSVSGPIVVDGKVFTTSSSAMEGRWIHVTAVDADTGEIAWSRSTKSTGRPYCHPTSANAAPTPCSDGERIFAFFSSNDIVCYDLEGNLQWFRSMTESHPLAGNDVGMSSSPLVVGGVVVVTVECQGDSFTAGLDAATGATLWEIPRPRKANWASPRVAEGTDGRSVIVLHGASNLVGIAPETGRQVWQVDLRCSTVASSVFADGKLFVPAGGVKVFEMGDAFEEPKQVADTSRISPNSASLLVTRHGLIGLNRSILACCSTDGNQKWKARLEDAGQVWSTPVVSGNRLYAFAMDGKCFTFKISDESAELLSKSELGEQVLGTPAISDDAIFVKSVDALWKIAATD